MSNTSSILSHQIEKGLGRELAHSTEKSARDAAVEKFKALLSDKSASEWEQLEFKKCWKGLFYCYWMSDKPLVQQELANALTGILLDVDDKVALMYLDAFWETIVSEWHGIDRIRLNKYYLLLRRMHVSTFKWLTSKKWDPKNIQQVLDILEKYPLKLKGFQVPDSLRYHTIEVFFSNLAEACNNDPTVISKQATKLLFSPFITWIKLSDNERILKQIFSEVLDLYKKDPTQQGEMQQDDEDVVKPFLPSILDAAELAFVLYSIPSDPTALSKNKRLLSQYLTGWSEAIGIPFVSSITVTGLDVKHVDVPFDAQELKKATEGPSKKRKQDSSASTTEATTSTSATKKNKKGKVVANQDTFEDAASVEMGKETNSKRKSEEGDDDAEEENVQVGKKKGKGAAAAAGKKDSKMDSKMDVKKDANDAKVEKKGKASKETKDTKEKKSKAKVENKAEASGKKAAAKTKGGKKIDESKEDVENVKDKGNKDETPGKKSVSWGSKRIKPFKKNSQICSADEAQKAPKLSSSAPKVLKAFDPPLIKVFTEGSRKSSRNK